MASGASGGQPAPAKEDAALPFTLQPEGSRGDWRVSFRVPHGWGAKLSNRPVAANGGLFELNFEQASEADSMELVQTVFFSPKPERTAQAIAKVLAQRLAEAEEPDVECSIS
ncbi:unnamed protein product [Symbiodinium natans]|uniref:Uncharacterized protein n=1 Tax=Symbiodinium natans TaxID=878477 RepID=A0A812NMG3_9DINO|nr:unnamed protein product [Symbiodinium natans]